MRFVSFTILLALALSSNGCGEKKNRAYHVGWVRLTDAQGADEPLTDAIAFSKEDGVVVNLLHMRENGGPTFAIYIHTVGRPEADTEYALVSEEEAKASSQTAAYASLGKDTESQKPLTGTIKFSKVPAQVNVEGEPVAISFALKTEDGRSIKGDAETKVLHLQPTQL